MPTERQLDWPHLLNEALTLPGNTGQVYNRFYQYSFLNTLLLRQQGVHEPVATYKRWQEIGRHVLKGAKAKKILRPITVKREDEDGTDETLTRFKLVNCIFALSDTDGEDISLPETPEWNVEHALTKLDIKRVPFKEIDGNMQGYSFKRNIAISPIAVYPFKTTIHEIGHVVLGHTEGLSILKVMQHRGLREFQAESTAHLVCNELDQLPEDAATVSRGYIQGWLRGDRPADHLIRQVFAATDKILRAGRVTAQEQAA